MNAKTWEEAVLWLREQAEYAYTLAEYLGAISKARLKVKQVLSPFQS
jgi:hypothetical protein